MSATTSEFQTSLKTRLLYSLTSLGVATPAEAIALLWLYPLHGRRLDEIKAALEAKKKQEGRV